REAGARGGSAARFAAATTLQEVTDAAVAVLAEWGADKSTFYIRDGDELALVSDEGVDDVLRAAYGRIPLDFASPTAEAARRGARVVVSEGPDFDGLFPGLAAYRRGPPLAAGRAVPLRG